MRSQAMTSSPFSLDLHWAGYAGALVAWLHWAGLAGRGQAVETIDNAFWAPPLFFYLLCVQIPKGEPESMSLCFNVLPHGIVVRLELKL